MSKKSMFINSALCVVVAGIGFGGWTVVHGSASASTTTRTASTVQRGSVQTSVTATGNLSAITQLDVSFDTSVASQAVTEIMVKVGDKVTKGQPLAKVNDTAVVSALASATAQMVAAQANYDKVKAGLSADEKAQLDIQEAQSLASLGSAQASLANAQATADQDAVTSAESVRQAQLNLTNVKAQADHDVAASQATYDTAKANYDAAKQAYDAAVADVAKYTEDQTYCTNNPSATAAPDGELCSGVAAKLTAAAATLTQKTNALTPVATAFTNAATSLDNQKLKSKQSVDSATNSVINAQNNQASGLLKNQQSIATAQRQLESAELSYQATLTNNAVKRKTPTDADIAQQQVSLVNAQNSLATAQKNAAAAVLLAPSNGTVTVINGRLGFAGNATSTSTTGAGATAPFATLTDPSAFEVKVGFSETDAAKVKSAQTATITIDAVSARLAGTVRQIDSASTLVNNVVTYYAYVSITSIPSTTTVQAGMTASVAVATQRVDNALFLPTAAVSSRGTTATVNVAPDKNNLTKTVPREITLGLRGDTGIQILTGLEEGEVVVTARTAVSTAQGTQTSTGTATNPLTGGGIVGGPGGGGAVGGPGGR
jgi:multidrug efflux pump subunit AcrA (membrane-fusion protein)